MVADHVIRKKSAGESSTKGGTATALPPTVLLVQPLSINSPKEIAIIMSAHDLNRSPSHPTQPNVPRRGYSDTTVEFLDAPREHR